MTAAGQDRAGGEMTDGATSHSSWVVEPGNDANDADSKSERNASPDSKRDLVRDSTPDSVGTGSKLTRRLGVAAVIAIAATLLFGLVLSGPEVNQRDAARLFYVHLPSVFVAYTAFTITLVGSVLYLVKKSTFWDLVAGAAAEIGVIFTAFILITGMLWGKPTWGVYWEWSPRLTSTAVMFVMYIGYLAIRNLELPDQVRSQRSAVLGIINIANVVVVHFSIQWWRGLHQGQTLGVDTQLDGLMLFSLFLGVVAFMTTGAWLLIHRFRLGWLQHQQSKVLLETAIAERQAEAETATFFGQGA